MMWTLRSSIYGDYSNRNDAHQTMIQHILPSSFSTCYLLVLLPPRWSVNHIPVTVTSPKHQGRIFFSDTPWSQMLPHFHDFCGVSAWFEWSCCSILVFIVRLAALLCGVDLCLFLLASCVREEYSTWFSVVLLFEQYCYCVTTQTGYGTTLFWCRGGSGYVEG